MIYFIYSCRSRMFCKQYYFICEVVSQYPSWIKLTKFMIKQYYKSIGVKKNVIKQDVIAFVNTVTQFIHRGS
jgi:hypothetical protein